LAWFYFFTNYRWKSLPLAKEIEYNAWIVSYLQLQYVWHMYELHMYLLCELQSMSFALCECWMAVFYIKRSVCVGGAFFGMGIRQFSECWMVQSLRFFKNGTGSYWADMQRSWLLGKFKLLKCFGFSLFASFVWAL
jgi:predicted ferric reductase